MDSVCIVREAEQDAIKVNLLLYHIVFNLTFPKTICQRDYFWGRFHRPNVLAFYARHIRICLISPCQENVNVVSFLDRILTFLESLL
jgi:hypothetical protein